MAKDIGSNPYPSSVGTYSGWKDYFKSPPVCPTNNPLVVNIKDDEFVLEPVVLTSCAIIFKLRGA